MKDLYSSVNQNSERINQDSSLRWNKTSTQQQTNSETLGQQKSNSWTPVGPTKDRSSDPSQLNWKLYAGAIIKSEARTTGVQLKRSAKLINRYKRIGYNLNIMRQNVCLVINPIQS